MFITKNKKLNLKKIIESDLYPRDLCCIAKCFLQSDIIDATYKYSNLELPLCDKHWLLISGE
jgi:hypothetical protein